MRLACKFLSVQVPQRASSSVVQAFRPAAIALRHAQGRPLTGQGAPELRSFGSSSSAPAAINGLFHRHLYSVISVRGDSIATDRITVIAAIREPAARS
jgi:hypothetical protein